MNLSSEAQAQIRDFTVWSKVSTVQSRSDSLKREEGAWEFLRPDIPEICEGLVQRHQFITCPGLYLEHLFGASTRLSRHHVTFRRVVGQCHCA